MSEGYVQVSPDSNGKRIAANADNDGNFRQVIEIGDGAGADQFMSVLPTGAAKVDGSATTQPVSAVSLPLPTGAAADGTDNTGVGQLNTGTGIRGWLSGIYNKLSNTLAVSVTNFPATQPVSGTVTANQGTAAALAGAWPVEVTDGTNVLATSSHPVRTDPTGTTTQPVSGTVTATQGGAPWSANIPTTGSPTFKQQKVTTGGTAVQLTSVSTPLAQGLVVQALAGNTDQVYVGITGVHTTHDGTGDGWELQPGQCSPVIPASNANLIYINSATAGSAVCWTAA